MFEKKAVVFLYGVRPCRWKPRNKVLVNQFVKVIAYGSGGTLVRVETP